MKKFLALMLSLYVLSTIIHASDTRPSSIVLDNKATEALKSHMITHIARHFPESHYANIREELNNAENVYVSIEHKYNGTKYGGYWVVLTTDSVGFKVGYLYTRKEFTAAINESTTEWCC